MSTRKKRIQALEVAVKEDREHGAGGVLIYDSTDPDWESSPDVQRRFAAVGEGRIIVCLPKKRREEDLRWNPEREEQHD